jgi:hypothetical protein
VTSICTSTPCSSRPSLTSTPVYGRDCLNTPKIETSSTFRTPKIRRSLLNSPRTPTPFKEAMATFQSSSMVSINCWHKIIVMMVSRILEWNLYPKDRARNSGLPMAKSRPYFRNGRQKQIWTAKVKKLQVKFYIDIFHFICLPQLIYTRSFSWLNTFICER